MHPAVLFLRVWPIGYIYIIVNILFKCTWKCNVIITKFSICIAPTFLTDEKKAREAQLAERSSEDA